MKLMEEKKKVISFKKADAIPRKSVSKAVIMLSLDATTSLTQLM